MVLTSDKISKSDNIHVNITLVALRSGGHTLLLPDLGYDRRLVLLGQDGGAGQRGPAHRREIVLLPGWLFSDVVRVHGSNFGYTSFRII